VKGEERGVSIIKFLVDVHENRTINSFKLFKSSQGDKEYRGGEFNQSPL
jgi:hypothetical protein